MLYIYIGWDVSVHLYIYVHVHICTCTGSNCSIGQSAPHRYAVGGLLDTENVTENTHCSSSVRHMHKGRNL